MSKPHVTMAMDPNVRHGGPDYRRLPVTWWYRYHKRRGGCVRHVSCLGPRHLAYYASTNGSLWGSDAS